jgi:hypothetical protein
MNEISGNQSVRWNIANSRVAFDVSSLMAAVVGGEDGRGCQMMATKMTMTDCRCRSALLLFVGGAYFYSDLSVPDPASLFSAPSQDCYAWKLSRND